MTPPKRTADMDDLIQVRKFIAESGMSNAEIARRTDLSRQTISKIRNWDGREEMAIGYATMAAIYEVIGKSKANDVDDILSDENIERMNRAVIAANKALEVLGDNVTTETLHRLIKQIYLEQSTDKNSDAQP